MTSQALPQSLKLRYQKPNTPYVSYDTSVGGMDSPTHTQGILSPCHLSLLPLLYIPLYPAQPAESISSQAPGWAMSESCLPPSLGLQTAHLEYALLSILAFQIPLPPSVLGWNPLPSRVCPITAHSPPSVSLTVCTAPGAFSLTTWLGGFRAMPHLSIEWMLLERTTPVIQT